MITPQKRVPLGDPPGEPEVHAASIGWDLIHVAGLINELTTIHSAQKAAEVHMKAELERVPEEHRPSARNLLHYLALRGRDVRGLQEALASIGLSSLGRAEGHIMHNVLLLLKTLHHLVRHSWQAPPGSEEAITRHEGARFLGQRASSLLGEKPPARSTRIMVTMPSEASRKYGLIRDLVEGGMDSMRINCAHDGPDEWAGMIANLRRAEKELGRRCSVLMDLGGPKIRTGPVAAGPKVLHWKPARDEFGRPKEPARIWLTSKEAPLAPARPADAVLQVRRDWLARLEPGEQIRFRDTRNAKRVLVDLCPQEEGCWALSNDTCYVVPGTPLVRIGRNGRKHEPEPLGDLPCLEQTLALEKGDRLLLTRSQDIGRAAAPGRPAHIPCTLPEALADVRVGDPVRFDDGRFGGNVIEKGEEGVLVEITNAPSPGSKLGADKGINFPASMLSVPSLTQKDVQDLKFISRHADMVGYSFVRAPEDVHDLRRRLQELGGERLGIILKIETQAAFANLPGLLLAALEAPSAGVMIARGDLAIECGYERLAELQEEILWLCESAHLPVIWATQVLEHLAKDGQPSRAEVTDAAMGERAECIMLNKGPHVVEAVRSLDDIIRRMETHQAKKTPTLRPLRVAVDALGQKG